MFFEKSEFVFKEIGQKERYQRCRAALKEAGVRIVEAGSVNNTIPVGGCGAKLDIRDFGPRGKIDRNTYYICVRPADAERAREVLAAIE